MKESKQLRIGYDAKRIVKNSTGLGNYSRTLIKNLLAFNNFDFKLRLYTPDYGKDGLRKQICEDEHVCYVYPTNQKSSLSRLWWRFSGIVHDLIHDRIDIYHGLSNELPKGLKVSGIKGIVTIHDLIFLCHPEYYHWWDVLLYRYKFHLTCKEACHIIAISECTKRDVMKYGNVPAEKISVIYQDCDTSFKHICTGDQLQAVKQKYQLPDHFILNVGSIEERKNVLLAVKALNGLPEEEHLVIVGKHTPYTDVVKRYVEANQLQQRVTILHGIPFTDLPAIYQLAHTFVYPSRYEGFGIPVIEAIHSGLPVVACTGSCLEEAGGPHNFYVHPDDVEGMQQALIGASDAADRERRIADSKEYVKRFETKKLTDELIQLYQNIV